MDELIRFVATQSIWAALSLILIFYILKTQETRDSIQEDREKKYQSVIDQLTGRLEILGCISEDIKIIKDNTRK